MVSMAFGAVYMETAQAHVALNQVESHRNQIGGAINAFITAWEGRRGFTIRTAERLRTNINAMLAEINARANETEAKVVKLQESTKATTRMMVSHVYHMVGQAWNMIEQAMGMGKTTAGRIISLGISAVTALIGAGYSAVATYSAMGPAGLPFVATALAGVMASTGQQASMIAQQAAMDAVPDSIGEIMLGAE